MCIIINPYGWCVADPANSTELPDARKVWHGIAFLGELGPMNIPNVPLGCSMSSGVSEHVLNMHLPHHWSWFDITICWYWCNTAPLFSECHGPWSHLCSCECRCCSCSQASGQGHSCMVQDLGGCPKGPHLQGWRTAANSQPTASHPAEKGNIDDNVR